MLGKDLRRNHPKEVSTAWRYVRQAVHLLAAHADDLTVAIRRAARLAYAILDGTLTPIDRVADQKSYYSGNISAVASTSRSSPPPGRLIWAS